MFPVAYILVPHAFADGKHWVDAHRVNHDGTVGCIEFSSDIMPDRSSAIAAGRAWVASGKHEWVGIEAA